MAGKHVLCEKPVALNSTDLDSMLSACSSNDVVFMDGVMFMHHERLAKVMRHIQSPHFGRVRRIQGSFSFRGDASFFANNIRCSQDGDPLGCLGDLGWYNTRFALHILGYRQPHSVKCDFLQTNAEGVPLDAQVEIYFDAAKEVVCSFQCSFIHPFRQTAEVVGERKVLRLDDFVLPRSPDEAAFEIESFPGNGHGALEDNDMRVLTVKETVVVRDCQQEVQMWQALGRIVLAQRERKEKDPSWQDWSRVAAMTQLIMDAAMKSATGPHPGEPVLCEGLGAHQFAAGGAAMGSRST